MKSGVYSGILSSEKDFILMYVKLKSIEKEGAIQQLPLN